MRLWHLALLYLLLLLCWALAPVVRRAWRSLRQSWDDLSTRRYKGGG